LIAELLFFFCKTRFDAGDEVDGTTGCAVIEGCGAVLRRKSMSDSSSLLGFSVATSSMSSSLSSIAYGSRTLRCLRFGVASFAVDCDEEDVIEVFVLTPIVPPPGFAFLDRSKSAVCEFTDDCTDCAMIELSWVLDADVRPGWSLSAGDTRPFKSSESIVVLNGATVRGIRCSPAFRGGPSRMKSANALVVAFFDTWASRGWKRDGPEVLEVVVAKGLPVTVPSGECKGTCLPSLVGVRECSIEGDCWVALRAVGVS
jgi:hypothetical protein